MANEWMNSAVFHVEQRSSALLVRNSKTSCHLKKTPSSRSRYQETSQTELVTVSQIGLTGGIYFTVAVTVERYLTVCQG